MQIEARGCVEILPNHKQASTPVGKISAQPHTTLCLQFLDRENNDKNSSPPLRKQICFTIVWGCEEILPHFPILTKYQFRYHKLVNVKSRFTPLTSRANRMEQKAHLLMFQRR